MPQAIDEAGNIWETDAQGNPVRFVGKANSQQQASPQPVTLGRPDPAKAAKEQRDAAAFQTSQAMQALQIQKMQQELQKGATGGTQGAKIDPGAIKRANLDSLTKQLSDVEGQFNNNFAGQNDRGFAEYLPTPTNKAFDAAAAGLSEQALGAFRVPGVGSQSDTELRAFVEANRPGASEYDEVNAQRLQNIKTRIDEQRAAMGMAPAPWAQQDQQPAPALGIPATPSDPQRSTKVDITGPGGDGGMTLASGQAKTENDPTLRGVNDRVRKMIDGGSSPQQIMGYLQSIGLGDGRQGFSPIGPGLEAATQWKRQHPGTRYTGLVNIDDRLVPMSGARSMINAAGQSAPGAYAINAADALTMGNLDSMTGNPELTRAGMAGVSAMNPKSALAGQVTGATLGTLGVGKALGAGSALLGARGAALASPLAADIAYGAGYGAGNNDENRMAGAAMGGALGFAGNKIGTGAVNTLGRAVSGVTDSAVRNLDAAGVPMTLGQMVGQSGIGGRMVKGAEDRLSGISVLGDMINARRGEGLKAYNAAEFNRGVAPIGGNVTETGPQGVDQAFNATRGAYGDAVKGVDIPLDQQYAQELGQAMQTGANLPGSMGEEFGYTMNNRVRPELDGGNITGEAYQAIMQGLKRDKASFAGQPRGYDFGQAIGGVQDATKGMMMRGGGASVVDGLNAADKAYGNAKILQDAVNRARNGSRSGEVNIFTPSQLIDASAASGKFWGGTQGTTRRPFTGLADDAQKILPNKVPDSGTAGRLLLPAVLGGGAAGAGAMGWIDPGTAALIAAIAAPQTKIGQKVLQKGLIGGAKRQAAGKVIKDNKALGGVAVSPLLLQYLNQ